MKKRRRVFAGRGERPDIFVVKKKRRTPHEKKTTATTKHTQ